MTIGKKSFWHPYFEIAADSDLPMNWPEKDLAFLEDEVLKMSILDTGAEIEEEYEEALEMAEKYEHLINCELFTFENYKRAYSLVMTRAFGWSLPYMMLVPFADNCNHYCIENYFELFNSRLTKRVLNNEKQFDNHEKQYFTKNKQRVEFLKHFEEDSPDSVKIYYNTHNYYKKLLLRDQILSLDSKDFVTNK